MNVKEIIEAGHMGYGDKMMYYLGELSDLLAYPIVIGFVAMLAIPIVTKGMRRKDKMLFVFVGWYPLIGVSLLILAASLLTPKDFIDSGEFYEEWKQEYVAPYFKSLETEKYALQNFNLISLEEGDNKNKNVFFEDAEEDELIMGSILVADENGKTIKIDSNFLVLYDLEEGEAPYIETTYSDTDLGHGIEKGYHNNVLHLVKQDL